MSLTRTTCPYCGVGCGVLAGADGTIKGDPAHPANFGRLCSKGSALGETLDLEGRLLAPQIGKRRASWDAALDLVSSRFSRAIEEHGPDSVAFYVSGQLLTEDYYVANKLMKGYIGSANIDTNSRLCMASSVAGHKRAFGSDTVPGTYADLEEADLIVLVGSNLAWCHPVLFQRIAAAKEARPGMMVVNIDPRRTATSALADLHLAIAPDGDVALFNGLLAHLAQSGAIDRAYVAAHVSGCEEALAAAHGSDPKASGLSDAELQRFFELWRGTKKVVTVYSQGVNQSAHGTDKVNAILNCHLYTGRIGLPGCGPFSVTGQPNAMGGREVGGLANMLANHLSVEDPDHRACVRTFWDSPTIATRPGLKAVDLFDACRDGQIKALWVMSTNPAVSMPDADGVAEAIKTVPFVVVSDIMERTDTGDLADVLLPAAGWGEKDGTVTNSERRISRQRAFRPAPGETRPDWQIICDVATRMGFAEGFDFADPKEIFGEYVALAKATQQFDIDLDLSVFADIDYAQMIPTQWPRNDHRFFADGRFYHGDRRAKMVPVANAPARPRGFTLNTGRNRDQWHTMTRTGKSPRLGAHMAEPYAEIHPQDAAALDLAPGDLVALSSLYGGAVLRVLITERSAQGSIFAPMHWTQQRAPQSRINALTAPVTDKTSGQPALKSALVTATRAEMAWYGFAASSAAPEPFADYAALSRSRTGWQMELAGRRRPEDWTQTARLATGITEADSVVFEDGETGLIRIGFYVADRLEALFFASRTPVELSRGHAISLIGSTISGLEALSGRTSAAMPEPGPTVCACFNVGRTHILEAIANGADSVAALGDVTCAGSNCGSCKPELAALLEAVPLPLAAE